MTTATLFNSPIDALIGDPVVALPAGTQVGHVLYAFHAMDWDTAADMLAPSSPAVREWTLLGTADHGANSPHVKLWRGVVTKAGANNVSFTGVGGDSQLAAIAMVGQEAGTDKVATAFGDTSGSHAAPSVDPDNADDLLLCFVCTNGTTGGYTAPGTMTERAQPEVDPHFMGVLASEVLGSGVATGTRTFTTSSGNVAFAAITVAIKGSANIAPTLLDYAESAFGGAEQNTETTDDLNWDASGNRVVAVGITENNNETINTPTATGVTFAGMTGTPTNTSNSCKGYAWQATASGDGNSTITASLPVGTAAAGIAAWAWAGASAPANPVVNVGTGLTVNVTVEDNASVVMVLGDWDATTDVAVDTVPAGGTIHEAVNNAGSATFLVIRWDNQPSGTRAYGVSGWTGTGTITKVAVTVPGTAAGGGTTPVSSDLDLRWIVATRVHSDLDVRWRVATRVTADHDFRWRTATLMASTHDFRWAVATRVTSDHDFRWLSRTQVTSDLDVRWRVGSVVTSDHDFRWITVGGGTTPVTSDLDLRWRSLTQVTSDLSVPWRVATRVTSDHDLRWAVRTRITSDHDLRWLVWTGITSQLDIRWLVSTRVQADHTFRWIVLSDVVLVPDSFVSLAGPSSVVSLKAPLSVVDLRDEVSEVKL